MSHAVPEPSESRGPPRLDRDRLEHLLTRVQDGVVSRRQLRELGARDHDIVRLVRRRDLVAVHPGVYVNHTGPLTWVQRAWVAVLACWPAALSHQSAMTDPTDSGPIHVAIDHRRSVRSPARVVVHRMADFDQRTNWRLSPPRLKLEHAAIDVALGKASVADRFRVLADACQTRETTAGAIVEALTTRRRVPDRSLLVELLEDLDTGACSVLERGYLDLERVHGLPDASRQRRDEVAERSIYRDAPYVDLGVKVELDGRAFHDNGCAGPGRRARPRHLGRRRVDHRPAHLWTGLRSRLRDRRQDRGAARTPGLARTVRHVSRLLLTRDLHPADGRRQRAKHLIDDHQLRSSA